MRYLCALTTALILLSPIASAEDTAKPDPYKVYIAKLSASAEKGDAQSQVCLGAAMASGMNGSQDFSKANEWYEKAADQGYPEGKRRLGQMYEYGLGVKQDAAKAGAIFQGLVDQGYMPAGVDMALRYENGTGVAKDSKLAVQWLEKAAEAGDYDAQTRLAIKYHFGDKELSKDPALSRKWLEKAVEHKIDCVPDYARAIPFMANANLVNLQSTSLSTAGRVGIRFIYKDRTATNVELMQSSGDKDLDDSWINALKMTKLPPWPESYVTDNKMMGFWIGDYDLVEPSKLFSGIRDAIQNAKVLPKDVLLYGSEGNGKPEVNFDYQDGLVSNVKIVKSSSDQEIDAAAVKAVQDARYPATPAEAKGKKLNFNLVINFGTYDPMQSPSTTTPPAAATSS